MRPFLVIAPPLRNFPSPIVPAMAIRMPVVTAPALPATPAASALSASKIGLERVPPRADLQVASLQKALARAQTALSEIDEELAERRQLNDSGVLDKEEVARFEELRKEAETEVRSAKRNLAAAQGETPESAAPAATRNAKPGAPAMKTLLPTVPPAPVQLLHISEPRWTDVLAPTSGLVVQPLLTPGTIVKKGTPLLRVSNSAWLCVQAVTTRQLATEMEPSTPVTVSFPEMGGMDLAGWVVSKRLWPGDDRAEVTFMVTRQTEGTEAQPLLFNLAYSTTPAQSLDEVQLLPSQQRMPRRATLAERMLGLVPTALVTGEERNQPVDPTDPLAGRLALLPAAPHFGPAACTDPVLQQRLTQLHDWQTSFIQGMTTAIFDQQITLSYPRDGEMSQAVERMVRGEVGHDPGYCARTLREALGLGLGDAYQWAFKLPQMGWKAREDGLPRPGDILVWPFTYGVNHSQHIGVAVEQDGRMVLLSNLEGRLGTSAILGGYVSFYKPTDAPAPSPTPLTPIPLARKR